MIQTQAGPLNLTDRIDVPCSTLYLRGAVLQASLDGGQMKSNPNPDKWAFRRECIEILLAYLQKWNENWRNPAPKHTFHVGVFLRQFPALFKGHDWSPAAYQNIFVFLLNFVRTLIRWWSPSRSGKLLVRVHVITPGTPGRFPEGTSNSCFTVSQCLLVKRYIATVLCRSLASQT